MPAMPRPAATLALVAAAIVALSACGSSGTPASSSGGAGAATTSATTSATSSPASTTGSMSASASTAKVNANTASKDDIAKALTGAGVPNSAKWANEIEEYRPYTQADMAGKLGKELGKYGVDAGTLQKILSVLTV